MMYHLDAFVGGSELYLAGTKASVGLADLFPDKRSTTT